MSKVNKSIDFSNLPKTNNSIDWMKSIGHKCNFIYGDLTGEIEIIDYNINGINRSDKTYMLTVKYIDRICDISISAFKKCSIGNVVMKHTHDYKYEINQIITSKTGNKFRILDREIRTRYDNSNFKHYDKCYYYECLECGFKYWAKESLLKKMSSCPCCLGRIVVEGINDIATTDPWMIPYFQGGESEAKLYTKGKNIKIDMICPICKKIKNIEISKLHKNHSIGCNCDKQMSFPEQLVYNLLKENNIKFTHQLSKKHFKWVKNYRYDFYLEYKNEKIIIECHGDQHYNNPIRNKKTIEEEQLNDLLKKNLALNNNIDHYYEVNCSKSNVDYILNSLKESGVLDKLNIDINTINKNNLYTKILSKDIEKCKEVVNKYPYISITELSNLLDIPKYRLHKILDLLNVKLNIGSKKIDVYKDGEYIYTFSSALDLYRNSLGKIGVEMHNRHIKKYIDNNKVYKKHYTFKYHLERSWEYEFTNLVAS